MDLRQFQKEIEIVLNVMRTFVLNFANNTIDLLPKKCIEHKFDTTNPGIIYDIYYEILSFEQKNELNGFTIKDFEYPESFNILIGQTGYKLRITKFRDNENDHVATYVVLNNKNISIPTLGYTDNHPKKHVTMDSIIDELYILKLCI
jgi:hypothetical protein